MFYLFFPYAICVCYLVQLPLYLRIDLSEFMVFAYFVGEFVFLFLVGWTELLSELSFLSI